MTLATGLEVEHNDVEPAQGLEVGATATIPYVMDGMRGSAGGELNGACQKHREV